MKQHIFPCQLYWKITFNSNWALNILNIFDHGPTLLLSDKQLSVLIALQSFLWAILTPVLGCRTRQTWQSEGQKEKWDTSLETMGGRNISAALIPSSPCSMGGIELMNPPCFPFYYFYSSSSIVILTFRGWQEVLPSASCFKFPILIAAASNNCCTEGSCPPSSHYITGKATLSLLVGLIFQIPWHLSNSWHI